MLETRRIFIKLKSALQMLSERTTSAFREDCLLSQDLHSWHVVVLLASILADAESSRDDALDLSISILNY